MSGRRGRFQIQAPGLLLLAGLGIVWWFWLDQQWTPEKIDNTIRIILPRGSNRFQVETWLNSHHIFHWPIQKTEDGPSQDILAEVSNVPRAFDWGIDIQITFHFDENDCLLWHKVDWFSVSP
jgi:hypothetical protein